LREAARVVATSELERQELLEGGIPAPKVVVRYNGIDGGLFSLPPSHGAFRSKWNIASDEPLIVFLSRLIPRKGADILIEAFAEVCANSARLVIAGPEGESGYRTYLEKRARDLGVADRVLFTGPVYDSEKKALLADADLFVLPSRYENFANVAAEAIAFGVPVIVSRSCGICEIVDGVAGLVIAPEKAEVANALRQLLQDKPLYARLKQGCPEVAGQLDWNELTAQMEGYYAQALAHGNEAHPASHIFGRTPV
jgi:glycosyltransferase involved in cell wall biosynthesis